MARTDGLFEIRQTGYVSPIDGDSLWLRGTDNYINFGLTPGASGYGFRDNAGVMEFKDAGGAWAAFGSGGGGGTWGSITGTLSDQTDLQTALNAKQATLVSGTNIKTVNGTSLLGSGDISISGGGMSIGGSITSATSGSVLFAGASGVLTQDNTNLFYDDTNNRLGVGTNAPDERLTIKGQTHFLHSATANPGGIIVRDGDPDVGGWANLSITGGNPAWTAATGIRFLNHIAQVKIYDLFVDSKFATDTGIFGGSGFGTVTDQIVMTTTGGQAFMWTYKYASSPYPPLNVSAPTINFRTQASAAWPDQFSYGTTALFLADNQRAGFGTITPGAKIHVFGVSLSEIGLIVQGAAGQTADLTQWQNSSSTVLSKVKADGSMQPASMADSAATNDSIYYSTTASKLVYKDAGGTVNALY